MPGAVRLELKRSLVGPGVLEVDGLNAWGCPSGIETADMGEEMTIRDAG